MKPNIKIKIDNLSYKHRISDPPLLHGINLEILEGEIIGVTGASGEGKSTLLRCIGLLNLPCDGSIYIDNINVTQCSEKDLREYRKNIGIIFQEPRLLIYKTIWNNIILPLKISKNINEQTLTKANELLELVGLSNKKKFYPYQLSGGQKQRISIVRALVQNQSILLCDEITSALDMEHANAISNLLKNINNSLRITIVFISHDLSIVKKLCNRHFILKNGQTLQINNEKINCYKNKLISYKL